MGIGLESSRILVVHGLKLMNKSHYFIVIKDQICNCGMMTRGDSVLQDSEFLESCKSLKFMLNIQ